MSGGTFTRKRFTLLIRKLTLEHSMIFVTSSQNAGELKAIKATSECVLNQEIPVTLYEDGSNANSMVELQVLHSVNGEEIEIGSLAFDSKSQKIMKPLSKEFFSKQLANKRGYIEYKFIGVESKNVPEEEVLKHGKIKNDLMVRIQQHQLDRQEFGSLMALINEKDQIIGKMEIQIQRLIRETKKLNKSLSKEKAYTAQQIEKNINLNVKFNPSVTASMNRNVKNNDWERERDAYEDEIERLSRKIRDLQSRQRSHREEMELMRKKMEVDVRDNQKKISDLRKEIEQRYEKEVVTSKRFTTEERESQGDMETEREKKNRFIQEQLAQQLKKIQMQKERQLKKDIEKELKIEIERQNERQKDRERDRQRERQREKERERGKERSKSFLRQSSADHKEFMKQINQLEEEKAALKQKIITKDEELHDLVIKLQRAQKQITKLEDENIELRKTKSSLLREVDEINFKSEPEKSKKSLDRPPIEEYEKMIINERKQIVDQKLKAQIEELRFKIRKDEKQNKEKLQEKDMEIMKLRLSEKSANREKEIYSTRIKEMMQNVEGDRKNFLQALENAHKFESQQTRTKELEVANNELETNNYKLNKEKQDMQVAMKKLKAKIDQRQGEWIRLKSIEAQHDYYKNQCQKFEKAYKKFEKQYESIKEYCQNLQHIVGKKPRKTFDEDINAQRDERYKTEVRNRLEVLIQEVKDMENKFYLEQIELWLTERTNIVQYYAKKFEEDKSRIMEMDNINEQAKTNLIEEKQKEINALKDQEINDVDRKVNKLKALIRGQEQKLVTSMIDKASFEQICSELGEKIEKLRAEEETRKKQVAELKEKNAKLETDLKERSSKLNRLEVEHQQKSLTLYPDDKDSSRGQDAKKSFIDQFKKSRDFYMNKPFDELKKLNAELQTEKRKVETQMNSIKFNFDKERVQLNDKIRTKERQLKKLEHEIAKSQKTSSKQLSDIEALKNTKDQLEGLIRRLREELKEVSRTLQLKQRQCSEALSQIKRMEKNLIAYEEAEKKMFEDVKKMKQKLEKKELQMEAVMEERNLKSKQIDAERLSSITKLEEKAKDLEFRLQKEITENLTLKNQNQKLSETITEYEVKLRDTQSQYEVLDQAFTIYKTEWGEKLQQYEEQNSILQNNIMQIANQMEKKESEVCEFQIKIEYSEKREEVLKNIKSQLEQENKQLKAAIETLQDEKNKQTEKFNDQVKAFDVLKDRIEGYIQENARLQLTIKESEQLVKDYENNMHEVEKEMIRAQCEKKNLETEIFYIKENFGDKIKQLENVVTEKQLQIQKIQKQKSRVSIEDKARKSIQALEQSPNSPMIQRKMLNTSIQRSNSLIQPPKSSKSIGGSGLVRKNSSKEPQQQQENEQLYFSKEGIEVNVKKPSEEVNQEIKWKIPMPKKESNGGNDSSKVDIDLDSEEEVPKGSHIESVVMNKEQIPGKKLQKTVNWPKEKSQLEQRNDPIDESEQVINEQNEENEEQNQNYEEQLQQMQEIIEELTNQRDMYFHQLNQLRNLRQNQPGYVEPERSEIDRSNINFLNRSVQPQNLRRLELKGSPSQKSSADINPEIERLNKKVQQDGKLIQELNQKVVNYELALSENENEIKELQKALQEEKQGEEKLISQIHETMKLLQQEVNKGIQIKNQKHAMQHDLLQNIADLEQQLEAMIAESMKKDETINETMSIIQNLNSQLKDQERINVSLQSDVSNLNKSLEKNGKVIASNKNEYRKYEEQAQLQILRLKEKVDELNAQLQNKDEDIEGLAEKYMELETKIEQLNKELNNKQSQVLMEKSKLKEAIDRRDQALEQMKKFQSARASIHSRIGDLEIKLGEKNQELKQLTKQTAIAYKKYEIQLSTAKEESDIERKKLKEREEHIGNLKLEMANYNDKCYELEREKNGLANELAKLEKQLREIMVSYQQELDQLHKDNTTLSKQIQTYMASNKQNELKMETLNKQISRRGREIKQLTFKLQQQQSTTEKLRQKNRKEVNQLISNLEIKNDEYHKIKIQLERETEHYFTKEVEYLADKEKRERMERDYNEKLEGYEKVLKELEEELKEVQNRPSVDQWEEICFENELYKNRIEELETIVSENGSQQQERIISEFKRYKISKQKQIEDLQTEMQKYSSKFHNLEQNMYVLKKDNEGMKVQLRTIMQEKMRMQKSIKEYEEDIRELKEEISFYKAKRVDDLNKLLNETYD